MARKLNNNHKLFCKYYITEANFNATKAYHMVYPNANYNTCGKKGYELAHREDCKAYMEELRKEAFKDACIDAERIAMKLAEIAFSERGDRYYNASAQLKALDLLQKQYNLQNQKIEVAQDVIEVSIKEDETTTE